MIVGVGVEVEVESRHRNRSWSRDHSVDSLVAAASHRSVAFGAKFLQNNLLAANEQKFYENSKRSGPTNSQATPRQMERPRAAPRPSQFIAFFSLCLSLFPCCLLCVLCLICSDSVKKLNQQNATATNLFTINYCGKGLIILQGNTSSPHSIWNMYVLRMRLSFMTPNILVAIHLCRPQLTWASCLCEYSSIRVLAQVQMEIFLLLAFRWETEVDCINILPSKCMRLCKVATNIPEHGNNNGTDELC